MTGEVLTLAEAAERLKISPKTLRRRIADGSIPAIRLGGFIRIRESELTSALRPVVTVHRRGA